jgi:serine/threonine protein kinase/Tol biopolymer transport system component
MTSARWRRIEEIYEAALQRAPGERGAFLDSECAGDEMLRRDVERLVTANENAEDFLASPAWDVAPSGLARETRIDVRDMSLVGRQVGHYRILAPLGRGGMGEVYRAHDGKLNREVALKVLPDLFALDPDRLARFTREAHVLASLNHPNIAAIYGVEDAGAIKALVLELVEGPTLADRIARDRIAVEDALPIGRQIADALEAAHERGIVHRDLKPANLKVRPDGVVKVLDFGLARALEVEASGAVSQSPTVPGPVVTANGMIVGTPAYMAPEQARGKPADKRTDLWAFGCVLYEMLTGRRAFAGEDTSETLAAVIRDDPGWDALPDTTPPSIRRLLRRCLAKDPKGRLSDAAVARIEIDEARLDARLDTGATPPTSRRGERVAWVSALLLVGAGAIAALLITRGPEPVAGEVRFDIQTPPTTDLMSLAISPDGQKIVFVATSEGRSKLWLRRLDSGSAEALAGTDGAAFPFWSPDSRSVAFFATDNRLKRLDIDGRSIQVLGMFPLGSGGTWNKDGTILFSHFAGSSPILRVSSTGGQASPATRLQPPELTHQSPQFLPDGRHFLYHSLNLTPPAVFVGDLEGSESRRLLEADAVARYVPTGHLLFARGGALLAQAFDVDRLALSGDPFRVAAPVAMALGVQPALFLSATSTLVFRARSSANLIPPMLTGARPLIWFDRSGKEVGRVRDPEPGARPSLSPDGRQVALVRPATDGAPPDIWLLGLDRGVQNRLTFGAINLDPIWSPDMRELAFGSSLKDRFDLYRQRLDRTGKAELLLATPEDKMPSDWSHDGRVLLYTTFFGATTANDIWALPLNGERKPVPVVQTAFDEMHPQFSPDGRWIAYESNETGQFEIYLQQFPGPGGRQRISTAGGAQVRWRRDGGELFYIALDGRLMAVPIRFASDGQTVDAGTPAPLFATHVGGAVSGTDRQQYVVSSDGQRFLMSVVPEDPNPPPITVILNWRPRPQS